MVCIRQANTSDVIGIDLIQKACHEKFLCEDQDTIEKIVNVGVSWVAQDCNGNVIAYMLCHWADTPPMLNMMTSGSKLFIHDLAVHKEYRGVNIGKKLIQKIYGPSMLLSLSHAVSFWSKMGYVPCKEVLDPKVMKSYGGNVVWMINLPPAPESEE